MSTNRRKLRLNTVKVSIGCGCRRPNLSDIFRPKQKPKQPTVHPKPQLYRSSSSSWEMRSRSVDETDTSTTLETPSPLYSVSESDRNHFTNPGGRSGRIGGKSVAVEKDSDDPYLDFRHSMLQMIWENEIYSKNDLRELLHCFLQLNSRYHHEIIVRAFTEIWNGVFSVGSADWKSREFRVPYEWRHVWCRRWLGFFYWPSDCARRTSAGGRVAEADWVKILAGISEASRWLEKIDVGIWIIKIH